MIISYNEGEVDLHAGIKVEIDLYVDEKSTEKKMIETTVGRVLFNQVVPKEAGYINELLTKKSLRDIIGDVLQSSGTARTAEFLDNIKSLGYQMSFRGGLSFNLQDVVIPEEKDTMVAEAHAQVEEVLNNYNMGFITNNERYNQIIDIWTHTNTRLDQYFDDKVAK